MGCFWAREDGGLFGCPDGGGCAGVVGLGAAWVVAPWRFWGEKDAREVTLWGGGSLRALLL